jgi:hypothetical protein
MINFLSTKHRKATEQQKQDKKLFRYAVIAFSGILAILLVAVGFSFFLQFQLNASQNKAKDLERQILANEAIEKSAVVLAKKVSVLKTLLEERQDKQQALEFFSNLFGSNVVLKDITYQATEGLLSLRVQAFSVFELEQVFNRLKEEETVARYGNVATSDLRRDQEGAYSLNLTISLVKEKPKASGAPAAAATSTPAAAEKP